MTSRGRSGVEIVKRTTWANRDLSRKLQHVGTWHLKFTLCHVMREHQPRTQCMRETSVQLQMCRGKISGLSARTGAHLLFPQLYRYKPSSHDAQKVFVVCGDGAESSILADRCAEGCAGLQQV